MILQYGDTSQLKGLPWFMLELRSEKTIESTMRRVGKAIPFIFRVDPIEIFIPVFKRDLDVYEMKTGCYIFVRSTNFQCLLRLKTITGVVSLVTEGDSNRPSKAIKVDDNYVQSIIREAEEEFRARALGIEVGSFVRILNGETRDFCGVVEIIGDGKAIVRVTLKTKSILLETPLRNLLHLPEVPAEQQVYYHSPQVKELVSELGDEGYRLIAEDRHLDDELQPCDFETPGVERKRHSRQNTVTALVKRLVLVDNHHDPMEIARLVIDALKRGEIRPPKNLFIVYGIIKDNLMRNYFRRIDPALSDYRDVIYKYGDKYKFSAKRIAAIDPELGIPIQTDSHDVCKDGRSREARQHSKQEKLRQQGHAVAETPSETVKRKRVLTAKNKAKMIAGLKRWHAARKAEKVGTGVNHG